ncbi:MAG: DUF4157 domain-containing protein [Candidatus Sphingomonas phytovorans]|nr:DUF4157 domain-containing protein [Sphingomonas sp.]WEK01773.1 MAG: DUF4157 domain-containing protein [Sphingomonas sp.]
MQETAHKPGPSSLVAQRQGCSACLEEAAQLSGGQQGYLAQLSEQINGRPGVQAAAQLRAETNASPRVQALSAMIGRPIQRAEKPANRTGLPDTLKAGVESLSGVSLDNVNVHYNSDKPAQLNAHAYAQGTDIHVAPGQERHLPHEAWHVVQQAQGRVQPTMQMKGDVPVNDDEGLEQEADTMGNKAASMPGIPSAAEGIEPPSTGTQLRATAPTSTPAVQRRMGLELEFPIPVDGLGHLSEAQQAALRRPLPDEERSALQEGALLDKDLTMMEGDGYVIRPDHQGSRLAPLMGETPAQALSTNITEFIFDPPVEEMHEVSTVLDNIFDMVDAIGGITNDLTSRGQLNGAYYVGPINTGGIKPDALKLEASSMQINFGIETQKIPDLFMSYARSTDLSEEHAREVFGVANGDRAAEIAQIYREALVRAATISAHVEEVFREHESVRAATPLRGIRGILAVQALYLIMGSIPEEDRFGGTVKNFTPLLMKSSLSWIADYSLTPEEQRLYAEHKKMLLTLLISACGGRSGDATPSDLLVVGDKGARTGITIEDLLTPKLDGPFVVPGAGIRPDSVGNPRSRDDPSLRPEDHEDRLPLPEYLTAPQRAPTREEIAQYGQRTAELLAPRTVEPTEQAQRIEAEHSQRRNRRRGGVFETRIASGNFSRSEAKSRAREMFLRVAILHGLDDKDLMTPEGQTDRAKHELGQEGL